MYIDIHLIFISFDQLLHLTNFFNFNLNKTKITHFLNYKNLNLKLKRKNKPKS